MGTFKPHTMRSTLSEAATGLLALLFTVYAGMGVEEKRIPEQGFFSCVAERSVNAMSRPEVWDAGHGLRAQGEERQKILDCFPDSAAAAEALRIFAPLFK